MNIRSAISLALCVFILTSCGSSTSEEDKTSDNHAAPKKEPASKTLDKSDVRFYHDFLNLGFDLPETWERASVETETRIRKMYYSLDHSKLAIDVVAVYQSSTGKSFISISTSSMDNDWVFDEAKSDEYFMNKIQHRYSGDSQGMRYMAFDLDFKGGAWTRVYVFNAPLRNFEIDLVTYGEEDIDTEQKVARLMKTIKI